MHYLVFTLKVIFVGDQEIASLQNTLALSEVLKLILVMLESEWYQFFFRFPFPFHISICFQNNLTCAIKS